MTRQITLAQMPMTGVTPSQVTFGLEVGPRLILIGVLFTLGIAAVGRASRISIAAAMRAV